MKQLLKIIWNDTVVMCDVTELAFVSIGNCLNICLKSCYNTDYMGSSSNSNGGDYDNEYSDSSVNNWSAKTYRAQASLHISGSLLHR
jgi:hypothetical protein